MFSRPVFRSLLLLILTAFWGCLLAPIKAQSLHEQKYNRFQYHGYKWQAFHTSAFHIYFPKGYDSLCAFTARELHAAMELVKKRMMTSLEKGPNIIIYPSVTQLYESNVGAFEPEQYSFPTVVVKGNRILLAYNGSYEDIRTQLRGAITRSIWKEQFQQNLESQLTGVPDNDKIPYWFSEGMISYFAQGWTIAQEDALRTFFATKEPFEWNAVVAQQPTVAGAAFCHFLSEQYYRQAPVQLFFQLRKKKDLARAARLIAKRDMDSLYRQCLAFWQQRFHNTQHQSVSLSNTLRLPHKEGTVKAISISPDNRYCAYILSSYNRRTVYLADLETREQSKFISYQLPPWIKDHAADPYPLTKWPTNSELLVAIPEKGRIAIQKYNLQGNRIQNEVLYGVDGVNAISDYEGNNVLLGAYTKAQSDIVSYDLRRERYKPITDDTWDDSNPAANEQTGQIIYSSQRSILKEDYEGKDSMQLVRGIFEGKEAIPLVTDTLPYISWKEPFITNDRTIAVTTRTGAARFTLVDKPEQPLSYYQRYSLSKDKELISFFESDDDSFTIKQYAVEDWITESMKAGTDTVSPWLIDYRNAAAERAKEDSILKAARYTGPSFLEGVLTPKNSKERAQQRKDSLLQSLQYDPDRVEPYILQLHSAYFTAKVNNDYFINRYQPYQNYQGSFKFPEVGGMVRGGFSDLFENHHFNIGYRMPAGTEGSDFFVRYENTAKKTDWSLLWFRKVESLKADPERHWKDADSNFYPNSANVKTNYYELSLNRPLNYYMGVSFSTAIRYDRTIFLATDKYSLTFEDIKSTWSISTIALNYNKLRPTLPFLNKGFRGKILLDLFKGFSENTDALYGTGIDLEYHQPLYRYITAVGRVQAGYSGGSSKILYNMGGVDNNLTIRADSDVHFQQQAPYAFQTLITPLRGHLQNSIYGNEFGLANLDVYLPLFQSLIPIETPLSFINNLQPGLFMDYAYAKETWRANTDGETKWSYGISARSTLAGYPVRVDIAWPGSLNKTPVWYLSLSL